MPTKSTRETRYKFLLRTVLAHDSDECLIWPFAKNIWGYGRLCYGNKDTKAHRLAFKIVNGYFPVNEGCHTCDNRLCYNPRHVIDGTRKENQEEMAKKGRACRGEVHHSAVFSESQVREIKAIPTPERPSIPQLAKKYRTTYSAIYGIVRGLTWKHVP